MKNKNCFFQKMDKIDKSLAGSLRKKRYINTQNEGGKRKNYNQYYRNTKKKIVREY